MSALYIGIDQSDFDPPDDYFLDLLEEKREATKSALESLKCALEFCEIAGIGYLATDPIQESIERVTQSLKEQQ